MALIKLFYTSLSNSFSHFHNGMTLRRKDAECPHNLRTHNFGVLPETASSFLLKKSLLKNQQVSTTPTGFKYLKLYFNKGSASQTCEACASSSLLGLSTASNGLCSMTVCFTGAKVVSWGNLNQNTCKHYHHALLHHFQQNKQISIHRFIINNYFTKAWLYKYSKLSNPSEWQVIQTLHYTHTKNVINRNHFLLLYIR